MTVYKCIYDNGTVITFDHFQSACAFMEELEDDFGYIFEYRGETITDNGSVIEYVA